MQESVSAILQDRAKEADGISRMLMLSLGVHLVLVVAFVLVPAEWRSRPPENPSIMTISLGGAAGPDTGGMTTIADQAVQSIAKPDAPKALETPPAAKPPEMIEPEKLTRPAPKPVKPIAKPSDKSTARTPTSGAEIKAGSARVKTGGAAIPFGGLAQGGGRGDGVRLDVQNFCCPEYLALMVQKIKQNWNPNQGATGQPEIKFTIRKDGMLTNVELEKSSGQALLDLEARRAVHKAMQLPPLPKEYPGNSLTIHLTFDFQR